MSAAAREKALEKRRKAGRLFIDQYGNKWRAGTVKQLREKIGGGHVSIMYQDTKSAGTVRAGYVIGQYWLTEYRPAETLA